MQIDFNKLLQGRYEAECLPKDFSPERTVPGFAFNVLNPLGLLYRPIIDEKTLADGHPKRKWPDDKAFAVCLTHDVDIVSLYSAIQELRRMWYKWRELIKLPNKSNMKSALASGYNVVRDIAQMGSPDPLWCFERWLKAEEKIGAKSTFFFFPEHVKKRHSLDYGFKFSDRVVFDDERCSVADMMREIDRRGWEVGLHPSWYSYNDVDELKRQKEQVERVLGHEIESVRQHCLHYDIRITPKVHSEAGFKYDSTLGFNDNIGFRFGTCYPWKLYDLQNERELPILEIPLIVQDAALLNPKKGMRLDEDTAFSYVVQIIKKIESVGGVLTLLWHPEGVVKPVWWNLYLRMLEYLKTRNPWFASVREIGEWWKKKGWRKNN